MGNNKKKKVHKLISSGEQLSINFKFVCVDKLQSGIGHGIDFNPKEICIHSHDKYVGKVISFSSFQNNKFKEIVDLTLETTKSF